MGRPSKNPDFPGATMRLDRKGGEVWRLRLKGQPEIRLPGSPDDECFRLAYQAATAKQVGLGTILDMPGRALSKTFAHAQRLLEASMEWQSYDFKTQRYNSRLIERFLEMPVDAARSSAKWRDAPVEFLRAADLRAIITGLHAETPTTAKHMLVAVRKLLTSAIEAKWIEPENDPALSIKVRIPKTAGHKKWSRIALEAFEERHPIGTAARTAYELARWLGTRRCDMATLTWDALAIIEDEESGKEIEVFEYRQKKNALRTGGAEMLQPITDRLAKALAPLKREAGKTVLQRFDGEPFSEKSLTGRMADWTKQAGLPGGDTLHGLRRTFAIGLAESGVEARAMMDAMGHSDLATTGLYLREASKSRLMLDATSKLNEKTAKQDAAAKRAKFRVVG
jgi:integrase